MHLDPTTAHWHALDALWHETRNHWRDSVAADFESTFWRGFNEQVVELVLTMEQLNDALEQAEAAVREL